MKSVNGYSRQISFYDRVPKAVFAAVAVSIISSGGDHLDVAEREFLREWWVLFHNGIVSQRPPRPEPENL